MGEKEQLERQEVAEVASARDLRPESRSSPAPAEEVERELRELVEHHWSRFSSAEVKMLRRAIAALAAERGRLRAAMEEAAKIADLSAYYNGNDDSRREVAETIAREIRAASQQGKGD